MKGRVTNWQLGILLVAAGFFIASFGLLTYSRGRADPDANGALAMAISCYSTAACYVFLGARLCVRPTWSPPDNAIVYRYSRLLGLLITPLAIVTPVFLTQFILERVGLAKPEFPIPLIVVILPLTLWLELYWHKMLFEALYVTDSSLIWRSALLDATKVIPFVDIKEIKDFSFLSLHGNDGFAVRSDIERISVIMHLEHYGVLDDEIVKRWNEAKGGT